MMDMRRVFWVANYFFLTARRVKAGKIKRMKSFRAIELRILPYFARMFIPFYPPFPSIVLALML